MKNLPMTQRLLCIVAISLLVACGELAYKRGAGVADLHSAQQACRSQDGGQLAIEKCLQQNGWFVQNLDQLSPLASISPLDNREIAGRRNASQTGSPNGNAVAAAGTETAVKPADPMESFLISSWWKIGSGPDELKLAIHACSTASGEAHRPLIEASATRVTRGLLLCMREQGWHALQS